ncbi:MAG: penicillin-binding protein 2 [Gammaproteobacteria bacterium]|nr:MAG: penicillin-binding protein 2 [Gammaproteobacteria bacterium]
MRRRDILRNTRVESQLFIFRTLQATFICLLAILIIVARLYTLQVIDYERYATESRENRIKLLPVPPTRGLIYDRNGVLLAGNQPSYSIELTPERVPDLKQTLMRLQKLLNLTDLDIKRFHRSRKRKQSFVGIPIKLNLSDEEVAQFAVNQHRFPGVSIVANLSRYYPLRSHATHAVGYVGRINEDELQNIDAVDYRGTNHIGKVGIEKAYEDILHGSVGNEQVEINARGRILRKLKSRPALPGKNLHLTIDSRIQAIAEQALGDNRGAIVAIDPRDGGIIAFVSQPSFDPNYFVNGIDPDQYAELRDAKSRPLFNRALSGGYPPGSTIKPFIALAGLQSNTITASQITFCPGYYTLPGDDHKYRDWKKTGHGEVNLRDAITESCDVYFYDLARRLGIGRIHDALAQFGFGVRTGIDIEGELSGLLPSKRWKRAAKNLPWYPGETLITGIGQGFILTTPLQLATATAIIANRGRRIRPHLVKGIEDILSNKTEQHIPKNAGQGPDIDERNWDEVIGGMVDVVHSKRGTARRIGRGINYKIAGKTGTAQLFSIKQDEKYEASKVNEQLRDHALFIAFAPADNPQIAISVIVENGGSGSSVAAPIAATVIKAYLSEYPPGIKMKPSR